MARIVVSIAARADLRRIIDYLQENAGQTVALRYSLDFEAAFDRLVDVPAIGSPRSSFGAGTRIIIVAPYLIFISMLQKTIPYECSEFSTPIATSRSK
jgi:plasmid stabilization system protein ParE